MLAQDAQYDLACACGTRANEHRVRGAGHRWLYPVSLPQGGTSVLLKTLLSNACSNDCKYCPLRRDANTPRCTLTPEELVRVFLDYWQRREVFGLFLTSGVTGTPDQGMERMLAAARHLRKRHHFRGYLHLKILPGSSEAAIEAAVACANAVSLNIEVPGRQHFRRLSERKDFDRDIIRPLRWISRLTAPGSRYAHVKCTTQFVVGAADETDAEIVRYMTGLYTRLHFNRIYFSAYQPGLGAPDLPSEQSDRGGDLLLREHRLYQADFLLRKYGFAGDELVFDNRGYLALDADPKEAWARQHPDRFPVRANTADRAELLRVPGLGLISVDRILQARRHRRLGSLRDAGLRGRLADKATPYLCWS